MAAKDKTKPEFTKAQLQVLEHLYDLRGLTMEQMQMAFGWTYRWVRQVITQLEEKLLIKHDVHGKQDSELLSRVYELTAKGCHAAANAKGLPENVYDEANRHVRKRNRYRPSDQHLSAAIIKHSLLVNTLLLRIARGVNEAMPEKRDQEKVKAGFRWMLGREFRVFNSPQPDALADTETTTYYLEADAATERPNRLYKKVGAYLDRLAKVVSEEETPRRHVLVLMCPNKPLGRIYTLQRWLVETVMLPPRTDVWIGIHSDMTVAVVRAVVAELRKDDALKPTPIADVITERVLATGQPLSHIPVPDAPEGVIGLKDSAGSPIYIVPAYGSFTNYFWLSQRVKQHRELGVPFGTVIAVASHDEAKIVSHSIAGLSETRHFFMLQNEVAAGADPQFRRLNTTGNLKTVDLWEASGE